MVRADSASADGSIILCNLASAIKHRDTINDKAALRIGQFGENRQRQSILGSRKGLRHIRRIGSMSRRVFRLLCLLARFNIKQRRSFE
jgi:hypothetical protein